MAQAVIERSPALPLEEGQRLACRVTALRQASPAAEVYLVGHSAGCAVVLAAAESLPPGGVNRIILLAPSASLDYDLRPALRCARGGIDVFYSDRDVAYLGLGVSAFAETTARQGRLTSRLSHYGLPALFAYTITE